MNLVVGDAVVIFVEVVPLKHQMISEPPLAVDVGAGVGVGTGVGAVVELEDFDLPDEPPPLKVLYEVVKLLQVLVPTIPSEASPLAVW